MTTSARQIPDPFAGVYTPTLLEWWHDPGQTAPDGSTVSHFGQLLEAVYGGGGLHCANDLEHLRHCFIRVVDNQRSRFGLEWRTCVCNQLPDDLEAVSVSSSASGDPRQGLASVLVDLQHAADALTLEGLRWPQTQAIFAVQHRHGAYNQLRSRLEAGFLPPAIGHSHRPPGWPTYRRYVWALMAGSLGWPGVCRWPNDARRQEFIERQKFEERAA